MKANYHNLLFLFFQCVSLFCFSQKSEEINQIRIMYPDANAIFLNRTEEYKIYIENNLVKGICNTHEQIIINKETGLNYQSGAIPTNNFTEASKIRAFIQIPDGKKYEKKEVDKIELKDNPDKSAFYDDQKLYSFIYPSAQVGAILNLDYQLSYNEPRFLGSYYWANYIPNVKGELKISVQKNIHIQYKLFNTDGYDLNFSKEETKDEVIYTWKSKNILPIVSYNDAPDFRYYEPHIIFYVTDYDIQGVKKQMLGSPKDLYKWYEDRKSVV